MNPIQPVSRRKFLESVSTAAAAGVGALLSKPALAAFAPGRAPVAPAATAAVPDKVPWKLQPFPMAQVRLRKGPFLDAMEANRRYLNLLPNNRLLHSFRLNAGFPSTAEPFGGWESLPDPSKPIAQNRASELRGHFVGGHYLSAAALTYASTGDEDLKSKANDMVGELARCQKALGGEYLSAYPTEFYDRLRAGQRVWAPFYTYHKIMAGHIDMYQQCGNEQALETAQNMAHWAGAWVKPLSDEQMARVQRTEFGGMAESLYNLYGITGKEEFLQTGRRFDDKSVFDPLAARRDELNHLHTNTNIPKIIGAARAYELTGEQRYHDIADYFWQEVTAEHTYCTGGTSNGEHWHEPGQMAKQLGPAAEECCCSYNMMKLTRHLYGLTGDPAKLDYYERLLYNVRLGTQDPDGMLMYYVSMTPGLYRTFSTPFHSFWCCNGSGVEEFAKTNDTIYFHDRNDLYVNLFIASELNWPERGIRVVQDTNFPEQESTTLTISADKPAKMAVNVRVPYWATQGVTVKVNGKVEHIHAQPSTYVKVHRTWKNGDKLEVALPMSLHVAPATGDPTIQAMMYGPLVLAGDLGKNDVPKERIYGPSGPRYPRGQELPPPPAIKGNAKDSAAWAEAVPGERLSFHTTGQEQVVPLVPFYKLFDDKYTIYWKVTT